jgi:broad specificity phosphatase PhoE
MTTEKAGPTNGEGPAFLVPELPADVQLWLVRHGETEWSAAGKHTGRTDVPLTEEGERQARAMRHMFADLRPALVLCSPSSRARSTARLAGFADIVVDDDLVEWDYGDYEGLTTAEIREQDPDWDLFSHGVPDGDTVADVSARADRVLAVAVEALRSGPVVLVGHGHLSRVLGARWVGLGARGGAHLQLGTAAPSLLGMYHRQPVIVHWNLPNPTAAQN